MQNENYDVFLPPFEVEAFINFRDMNMKSWGVDYLQAAIAHGRNIIGRGCIAFVVDTEDDSQHEAVVPRMIRAYNERFTDEPTSVVSQGDHGQHVAQTFLQVAPGALVAFKKSLRNEGAGNSTWVASGIKRAADQELLPEHLGFTRIIILSLGSNFPTTVIRDAVKYARSKGCILVAAAGNDAGAVDFPAAFEEDVIAVAAIDHKGRPASFSSRGKEVNVAAPGVGIVAAWRADQWAALSGTSMAGPHVAGVVALLREYFKSEIADMETFLIQNATYVGDPAQAPDDLQTGHGIPFLEKYLALDPGPKPDPVVEDGKTPAWVWIVATLAMSMILLTILYLNNKG